jgi:two-component system sensor histidine kinase KdpD
VLVEDLGGTYHQVVGTDIPDALLAFARGVNATQLVLGASRRGTLGATVLPRRRRYDDIRVRSHRRTSGHA